jgi:hypothetical protein
MIDTLMNRVLAHLQEDERIDSVEEAHAELNLMTHVELAETISFVMEEMLAELRPPNASEKTPLVLGPRPHCRPRNRPY